MAVNPDLVIRQARLLRRPEEQVDVAVGGGRILALAEHVSGLAATEIDAGGSLVTESFVNPHLHLDKVWTATLSGEASLHHYHATRMSGSRTAIELAAAVKDHYRQDWVAERARRAVRLALDFGTTHMRAFADTDTRAGLQAVKALLALREEFKGLLAIQVVAFPQQGVLRDPGAEELVREAVELGADVVGGIPWLEDTAADAQRHVDAMFEIATTFNRDVSMLVDDAGDPELRTLQMLARKTIEVGWQGRVLAHHARATALYTSVELDPLLALLREAGIGIVTDPHTGPLHVPVREMVAAGVPLALGQDDISDAYYPYGRNNMLEVAFLASHLLWMTTEEDRARLFRMVTVDAARLIGLQEHRLEVGAPANLVVLGAPDLLEALREHRAPAVVISHGKLTSRR